MTYLDASIKPHRSMREFLSVLESRGLLKRISKPVDRMWEIGTLAKWMFQALPEEKRFGMMFESVSGFQIPVVTRALGASRYTYAAALNVAPEEINDAWVRACRNPHRPQQVTRAACQEIVLTGTEACLGILPIPVWTPGKDVAPYVTTTVITRDHDTGVQNMGVYRTQVRDDASVVVNFSPNRQGTQNIASWIKVGKRAPLAWVIAAEPAVQLATLANLPPGWDELDIAGGMMGAPVEVVRTRTSDLLVPANAEIIIEGEVHPGETQLEGPFGEFAGFMGPVEERPIARILAITHQRNPLYYGYSSQMPPSESVTMQSLTNAGYAASTMGSKIVVDATAKIDAGPLSLPSKETMMKGLESWKQAGLPEFAIPRRAMLRIDKA